ncbi:hypothetical protein G7046_g1384 [Stylonectria norvegica]|nr:hypothetical protein G7046_g1384 [Stylonectria norvegica]
MPWEYSDIPADYVLGLTTCALFLSLKYHRLHPEYIYTRIKNLQGKYNLRLVLTMVDIPNHEDSLRELSKTSLVNNVTVILCWSAAEAARYLELYKSYEGASFGAIRGQQPSSYGDKLVEFVTVPRSLNKSDAVALVSNFGSLRNAINADPEQLGMIGGWGGIKVKRWTAAVEEPFRVKKAGTAAVAGALRHMPSTGEASRGSPANGTPPTMAASGQATKQFQFMDDDEEDEDDEDAMMAAAIEESKRTAAADAVRQGSQASPAVQADQAGSGNKGDDLSGGIAEALAKLRQGG